MRIKKAYLMDGKSTKGWEALISSQSTRLSQIYREESKLLISNMGLCHGCDIPSNTAESTIVAHFSAASLKTITFSLLSRENKMESAAVVVEVALFKSILAEGTCPAPSILARTT
uniref:Bm311 n=1 Tax=Brugia malayi TaxID=6279 RepID=A0A0J9XQ21_BRUMA|nr:Bm311 [Brugia malayi]